MSEHVRDVVLKCAQSMHVINMLRRRGMNDQALQAVYPSFSPNCSTRPVLSGASRRLIIDIAPKLSSVVESGPVSTRLTGQRQLS